MSEDERRHDAGELTRLREWVGDIQTSQNAHREETARAFGILNTKMDSIGPKLDYMAEKLSETREQAAEGKGRMAILWAAALAGMGAMGHTLLSVFTSKGQ